MVQILFSYPWEVLGHDGRSYTARAYGRPADDGLWEGWIEFVANDGSVAMRTPRETEQPNIEDLRYWAAGLTAIYLEGAFERAIDALVPPAPSLPEPIPIFDSPARPAH